MNIIEDIIICRQKYIDKHDRTPTTVQLGSKQINKLKEYVLFCGTIDQNFIGKNLPVAGMNIDYRPITASSMWCCVEGLDD
jgi:hypothetical protein